MHPVWMAPLILLPVQLGWGSLYWWSGRDQGGARRRLGYDLLALTLALGVWLAAVVIGGPAALPHGEMWAVIATTTAAFLGFNAVLAVAALLRPKAQ